MKRLDQKIASILRDPSGVKDFIIADAKDTDMAFGVSGPRPAKWHLTGSPDIALFCV